MKAKTVFLLLVVFCKIVDVNAQYQCNINLNKSGIEARVPSSYRMEYEDPKTGKIYPDSALNLMWNRDIGKWDSINLEIYTYNDFNKITTKVIKILDKTHSKFILRGKYIYSYNSDGKCISEYDQDCSSDSCKDRSRTLSKYNEMGFCVEILQQYIYTDLWENSDRSLWEYDTDGNLLKKYSQDWDDEMKEWYRAEYPDEFEYRYKNNKLIEVIRKYTWSDPMWYHHTGFDDYKLFYKNGENSPSKIRYQDGGNYPYFDNAKIYNDIRWNSGFHPDKLSLIEYVTDYIRQDSAYYYTWHPAKKRKTYKKNGLIRQDSIFENGLNGWVNTSSNYWYYNDKRQIISLITLGGLNTASSDTDNIYLSEYDDRGNKIFELNSFFGNLEVEKSGNKYTYTYFDSTDLITSFTNEEYDENLDSFVFITKVIYYPAQQHSEAKEPTPAKSVLIYPNPSSGNINISFKTDNSYTYASYQILDINGKIITEKQINTAYDISESIDMSGLRPGLYFLLLIMDNTKQYLKLIKQ